MNSQNREYHSLCPICHYPELKKLFVIDGFTITQCLSCTLRFVRELVSKEELDDYYCKDDQNLNTQGNCLYLDERNAQNLKYYYRNLKSLILERVPKGKILDIGCNRGYFLDVMEGFERYGIERSPRFGLKAQEKYGANIFMGTFEAYSCPDFLFDCITLQDVLDHMGDPLAVLKKCNRILKPGGLLVVKVHDISCLYAKLTGKNFYAYVPPLHLFYFNKASMIQALSKSSFDLIYFKHMAHQMFLSTVFYRLSKGNPKSVFFGFYKQIEGTWLGQIKIHKNLHDIMTVLGIKKGEIDITS